jgi:hypothetical protein
LVSSRTQPRNFRGVPGQHDLQVGFEDIQNASTPRTGI